MSKRNKTLGISDKGWSTIGTGFKWWLIAGGIVTAVVIVGGVVMFAAASSGMSGLGATRQLPPVRIL